MRYLLIVLAMLFGLATSALAQVSISLNLQSYPELVRVPGYPVYYSPRLHWNYFFYDGLYWIYLDDAWYESYWYNGPWEWVGPEFVPLFILRIPVRYYRAPPTYFMEWRPDAPPRWGQHWGHQWEQHRRGWDQWNRRSVPAPAPLPVYQRQYEGNRYPRVEQQHALRAEHYRYRPHDAMVRQRDQQQATRIAPAPQQQGQQGAPREMGPRQQPPQPDIRRSDSPQPTAPQVARPAQAAPPPEPHGRAEQRRNVEPRGNGQARIEQPQAAPPAVAPQAQAPRPEPAPRAEPRGHEPRPAADKPNDKNKGNDKGSDEQKGEQGNRRQER